MRTSTLIALLTLCAYLPGVHGQSVVFVSPSTKGLLTMSCAEGSLNSFEEQHYLAAAHYLAEHLCAQPRIDGGVGIWQGHAENSGLIDGCPNDRARDLGALLAKYYHQEKALIFERDAGGKTSLLSFRSAQPLGIISIMMAQAGVRGATVLPHFKENVLMLVAIDPAERAAAMNLYGLLHAQSLQEEPGNTELIGDEDRAKARDIYLGILAHAPADVRQLDTDMYTEMFNDLGVLPANTPASTPQTALPTAP